MAEAETKPPVEEQAEVDELETPDSGVDSLESNSTNDTIDATGESSNQSSSNTPTPPPKKAGKSFFKRFNVYLLLFAFILVIAGLIVVIAYFQSKKASTTSTLKTQDLAQATLDQVANSDASVGNTQQVLNVKSSAVFAGKVLIRDGLEVAGNLQIGGTFAVNNMTVSGSSQLGQVQINKDLSVSGNESIQGTLTIGKSLQVSGGGNFSGPVNAPQITTSNLQLTSDLTLTKHIISGGPTPSRSGGAALGGGGSASVSGSDTAGTVTINVGGGAAAGCFVTINFTSRYNSTPHVQITPVGAAGGAIPYYVNRNSSNFSICTASPTSAGASFAFDYFVIN